jgi:predicted ribosome quality control (RQC) complex YloA/Tae2 family protein
LRSDQPASGGAPTTGFQALLAARAAGPLVAVSQPGLDRVARFRFGRSRGFVETAPVELVAELTGRNGNLVLVDDEGVIIGAAREIGSDVNRYRQIRPGVRYESPPPYDKLDPRRASDDELAAALRGRRLRKLRSAVDGIGPELTATIAALAGVSDDVALEGDALDAVLVALRRVVADPAAAARDALGRPDLAALRARERREADLRRWTAHLRDRIALGRKRLHDAERTLDAADDAARLRQEGDLLLARLGSVPSGASSVRLPDWEGNEVDLPLDPARSPAENAEARYERARRREARAERALQRAEATSDDLERLEAALAQAEGLGDEDLRARVTALERDRPERRRDPGLRYEAPHGFTVVVGRNARENDVVTFKVARSRDLWLHVQGWHGSHVVVLSGGREVPFDTVLFAARLAAGHSKASGGDNVPVDYTQRKHVWKVKGAPAGAVHYAHQKTVYVTPSRNPAAEGTRGVDAR